MSYAQLRREAERRLQRRYRGKARIAVQDAQCSRAVGSQEVASVLREGNPYAEVVAAGCDGACFLAPQVEIALSSGDHVRLTRVTPEQARQAALAATNAPQPEVGQFWSGQRRRVLAACGVADPESIDDYLARGGYEGLAAALAMSPEQVIEQALAADIRGRGGAYFPAARKWQGARAVSNEPRYVVVNAEEGEPGIYKDRHVMEGDPHRLLEGLLIAGYASGAANGVIYINAEANLSAERVQMAVSQASERGLIGQDVVGSGFAFQVELRRGAGGYVCGEETTLLNTIEGTRRVPRLRPPFPVEVGLFGKPTVINNVETLCNVALLFAPAQVDGPEANTKVLCLSGAVQRPGLVEVAFGTTLRQVVYEIGGGPPQGRKVVGIVAGGPSGGLLPERMLDTAIQQGALHESGAVLGSGGVIVIDDTMSIPQVVRKLAAYNAAESCGKCTPCREGTPRMVEILDRLLDGKGRPSDLDELRYLTEVVSAASLCGLGQMAGGPITSSLHFFGDDFADLAGVR